MKPTVSVFDFDGTLTTRDTLLCFIRHAKGRWGFVKAFGLFSPLIVLMKLRLLPNWQVKQALFSYCFKGISEQSFTLLCRGFAEKNSHLLRPAGRECLCKALHEGHKVFVVSASIDHWVAPFFEGLPVRVIGTQPAVAGGLLTGKFATPNCYGPEKVNRLTQAFPAWREHRMVAYGDSRGDREMLALADEAHYKPFRTK